MKIFDKETRRQYTSFGSLPCEECEGSNKGCKQYESMKKALDLINEIKYGNGIKVNSCIDLVSCNKYKTDKWTEMLNAPSTKKEDNGLTNDEVTMILVDAI